MSGGYADKVETENMNGFSARLFSWFTAKEPELTAALQTGKKLDDETKAALNAALAAFAEAL